MPQEPENPFMSGPAAASPITRNTDRRTFLGGRRLDGLKAASLRIIRDGEQEQRADDEADRARRPQAPPA